MTHEASRAVATEILGLFDVDEETARFSIMPIIDDLIDAGALGLMR